MRIPTAQHGEMSAVIVMHDKHVLFSPGGEVLSLTACILLLDEFLTQV